MAKPTPAHSPSHDAHNPSTYRPAMADEQASQPQPVDPPPNESEPLVQSSTTTDNAPDTFMAETPHSRSHDDEDLPSYEESGSLTDGAIDSEHFATHSNSHSHSQGIGVGLGLSDTYQYVSTIPTDLLDPSPLPSSQNETFEHTHAHSHDETNAESNTRRYAAISYPPPSEPFHPRVRTSDPPRAPDLPSEFVRPAQTFDVDEDVRGRSTQPDYRSGAGTTNGTRYDHAQNQHADTNSNTIPYPPGGTAFAPKSTYNILTWHAAYISCQHFFVATGQYVEGVQALFDFINVRLPKDRDASLSSVATCAVRSQPHLSNSQSESTTSSPTPLNVPLLPYIRRLVATGFSSPELLSSIFGPQAPYGVVPLLETERQNLWRLFRHGTFDDVFRLYNGTGGEELPFLVPPNLGQEEVRQAERADRAWEVVERGGQ